MIDLSDSKLERYLREIHPPAEETFEIPEIDKVKTDIKCGDILQLGKHRLMCGDSTNLQDVDTLLENADPIMLFTDPPYGVAFGKSGFNDVMWEHSKNKRGGGFKNYGALTGDKTIETYLTFLSLIAGKLKAKSWYLCTASRFLGQVMGRLDELDVHYSTPIIWVKPHWVPSWERYHAQHEIIIYAGDGSLPTGRKAIWFGKNNESTVWQIGRDNALENKHPTQKPVELVTRAIINSSRPGDGVVDFFGGSGTTLIACEQTGRVGYMLEIDPRYCEIVCQRWEKYTDQKRVKLN